ncbi:hypothetical protein ACFXDJ_34595 [Streptomyces sp. NPDC059443]|uniref:hypothetical protein n=1 Tax=unclassified Streptomyces TaxID=2593676 RepID=UPI0036A702DF
MELEKSQPPPQGDGCLVGVVRVPVKVVAVLIVLPVRVVWDLLVALARMLHRTVLGPAGRGLAWFWERAVVPVLRGLEWLIEALFKLVFFWPWVGLWRYVAVPLGRGIARVARAANAYVLRPLGHGIGWCARAGYAYLLRPVGKGIKWGGWALGMALFYWPWVGLWRYVLVPAARGIGWCGRGVHAYGLRPLGQGLLWIGRGLHAHVLRPLGGGLLWLGRGGGRYLLVPLAKGLMWVGWALGMVVFVWPWVGLWRHVLVPLGRGVLWIARGIGGLVGAGYRYVLVPVGKGFGWLLVRVLAYGVLWPCVTLWRFVAAPLGWGVYTYGLVPLGRLLLGAWQLAGRVSRALWRGFVRVWRGLVVRPVAWAHRRIATPVGHAVRAGWSATRRAARSAYRHTVTPAGRLVRGVWNTSRLAVSEARADVRRMLFGGPPREPARSRARTLGSNTAVGDTPATPEISLHTQG